MSQTSCKGNLSIGKLVKAIKFEELGPTRQAIGKSLSQRNKNCFMEYLSQECYGNLYTELQQLIKVELPKVKNEISEARDKGDLSENFEYHAAKRAQGKLLSRIRFLERILENAQILDASKLNSETVGLFRKVEMTNLKTNAKVTYTIVNPHEANVREGKISIQSPIAKALLGKKAGDVVDAQVPAGILRLQIDSITV